MVKDCEIWFVFFIRISDIDDKSRLGHREMIDKVF